MGLKLNSIRSDRSVLGWEVRRSTREFALLAAGSRVGLPAELLFKPEQHTLLFGTFVQQQNPIVRGLWAAVIPVHQRVVRQLLEHTADG